MNSSLMCTESLNGTRPAIRDSVIMDDNRVLEQILRMESIYAPKREYFRDERVTPQTRTIVTKWMMEVCEAESCPESVLLLAINYFDRFMCICDIPKNLMQLAAADCILMASKLKQNEALSVHQLSYYTNYSVTASQLRSFELVIASKLEWELASVTGYDFLMQLQDRIRNEPWANQRNAKRMIDTHAVTLLQLAVSQNEFYNMKASEVAVISLVAAIRGLKIHLSVVDVAKMCAIVKCDVSVVEQCVNKLEQIVSRETKAAFYPSPSSDRCVPSKRGYYRSTSPEPSPFDDFRM